MTKETEINLSKKMFLYEDSIHNKMFDIEDVKEFIKIIKSQIYKNELSCNELARFIDEKAGDKLC